MRFQFLVVATSLAVIPTVSEAESCKSLFEKTGQTYQNLLKEREHTAHLEQQYFGTKADSKTYCSDNRAYADQLDQLVSAATHYYQHTYNFRQTNCLDEAGKIRAEREIRSLDKLIGDMSEFRHEADVRYKATCKN